MRRHEELTATQWAARNPGEAQRTGIGALFRPAHLTSARDRAAADTVRRIPHQIAAGTIQAGLPLTMKLAELLDLAQRVKKTVSAKVGSGVAGLLGYDGPGISWAEAWKRGKMADWELISEIRGDKETTLADYIFGGFTEIVGDPAGVFGVGLGLKGGKILAKSRPLMGALKAAGKKAAARSPGSAYSRALLRLGRTRTVGIPGSEALVRAGRGIGRAFKDAAPNVARQLTPAGHSLDDMTEAALRSSTEPRARAFMGAHKTADDAIDEIARMKATSWKRLKGKSGLTPAQMQRGYVASELVPHVDAGKPWALEQWRKYAPEPGVQKLARKTHDAFSMLEGHRVASGLDTPHLAEPVFEKRRQLAKELGQVRSRAAEKLGFERKLAAPKHRAFERVAGAAEGRAARLKDASLAPIRKQLAEARKAADAYEALARMRGGADDAVRTAKLARRKADDLRRTVEGIDTGLVGGPRAQRAMPAAGGPGDMLKTWRARDIKEGAGAARGTPEAMRARGHGILAEMRGPRTELAAKTRTQLADEWTRLQKRIGRQGTPLRGSDVEPALRRHLPTKDYARSVHNLKDFYAAQSAGRNARAKADAIFREVLDPKAAQAAISRRVQGSKRLKEIMERAAELDKAVADTPGYALHMTTPEEFKAMTSAGQKNVVGVAREFSLSGATKTRKFVVPETGRPLFLYELDQDLVRVAKDPSYAATKPYLSEFTQSLNDRGWYPRLVEAARVKMGAEPMPMVGRMFELDPAKALQKTMHRTVRDAHMTGFYKALGEMGSPTPRPGWMSVKAAFGDDVAEHTGDIFLPQSTIHEIKRVSENALKADGFLLRNYDKMNTIWKASVTGFWPSFQIRNHADDMLRVMSNGEVDVMFMHAAGVKSAAGRGTIDLGRFGKMSGRDFRLMGEGYGILEGFFEGASGRGTGLFRKGSSFPEHARRLGYFADRIKRGMAPLDAALDVKKVFFDYSALAPFERQIVSRILPFWNYQRNSIRFWVEKTFTDPWIVNSMLKFRRAAEDPDKPEWMQGREGWMWKSPGLAGVLYDIGFSVEDTFELLDAAGSPKGPLKGLVQWGMDQKSPFIDLGARMITQASGRGGYSKTLHRAPDAVGKLPETVRDVLGAQLDEETKRWMLPERTMANLRLVRLYTEMLKWYKPEALGAKFKALLVGIKEPPSIAERAALTASAERRKVEEEIREAGRMMKYRPTEEEMQTQRGQEWEELKENEKTYWGQVNQERR